MVAANDNRRVGRQRLGRTAKGGNQAGAKAKVEPAQDPPYTYTGPASAENLPTYVGKAEGAKPEAPYTYTRVVDDLGEHIELRKGEAFLLGRLIAKALEKMGEEPANDR